MTWEWTLVVVLVIASFLLQQSLGEIGRHTKQCAEHLVNIETELEQVHNRLSGIESDVALIRRQVAPTPMPVD